MRPAELVSVTSPPEAASGGMIGVVEDGDIISINIPENTIELKVDADILAERMKNFIPKKKELSGYLKRYSRTKALTTRMAMRFS